MWNPSERRYAMARWPVFGLLLALTVAVLPAIAAPQGETSVDRAELRRSLAQYEAIAIVNGVLLKPRTERLGVRSIEVTADSIAVNGERVTPGVLRAWLGEEAEPILALQALSAEERRAVLGLAGEGAARPPAPEEAEVSAEPAEPAGPDLSELPQLPEEPAEPAEPDERWRGMRGSGSRFNLGGSVNVDADEVAQEAVAVGGSVRVDGEVEQDAVAVGGMVRVNGTVGGEVVAVGGSVYLGPNARVEDNVTSIGGSVHKEEGAQIGGSVQEIGMFPFVWGDGGDDGWHGNWDWDWGWGGPWAWFGGFSSLVGSLIGLVFVAGLVCLVLFVAQRPADRVDHQLVAQPWACLGSGLAGVVGFWTGLFMLSIVLLITIIGCVFFVLYPFLFLIAVWFTVLGYAVVARRLGWIIGRRFGIPLENGYVAALVGVLALKIWSVFAGLLALPGLGFFAFMFEMFSFSLWLVVTLIGLGAVILARFGTAPGHWDRGRPAVPPVPQPAAATAGGDGDLPLSSSPSVSE